MMLPTRCTFLSGIPSSFKWISPEFSETSNRSDSASVTRRLISSGMLRSKLRNPASTWTTGISRLTAASEQASVLFTSPTVALAIALGGLLSFSALGGLLSERIRAHALAPWIVLAAAGIAGAALLLRAVTAAVLPLALPARVAAAVAFYGVPGFLIGIPFPAVMRILPASSRDRARAWCVNGCASVIVATGSAVLAPALGIRFLLLISAAACAAAAVLAAASQRVR